MKTLIFDTETTGLPKSRGENKLSDLPYLTQLAALFCVDQRIVSSISFYFKDSRIDVPDEQFFKDQGISNEFLNDVGVPYHVGLKMFDDLLRQSDRAIAHNMDFDGRVIWASYARTNGIEFSYMKNIPKYCTMLSSKNICNIPGAYGIKWPSLTEAYKHLVDKNGFEGAHDALADVNACHKVLFSLEKNNHKLTPIWYK